jgi:hypothetical protein
MGLGSCLNSPDVDLAAVAAYIGCAGERRLQLSSLARWARGRTAARACPAGRRGAS